MKDTMCADHQHCAEQNPPAPVTIRVEHDAHGGWSVTLPDHRVTCETLDDARRVAYLCAARARPCQLIVHDAYHRVLQRELIGGRRDRDRSPADRLCALRNTL